MGLYFLLGLFLLGFISSWVYFLLGLFPLFFSSGFFPPSFFLWVFSSGFFSSWSFFLLCFLSFWVFFLKSCLCNQLVYRSIRMCKILVKVQMVVKRSSKSGSTNKWNCRWETAFPMWIFGTCPVCVIESEYAHSVFNPLTTRRTQVILSLKFQFYFKKGSSKEFPMSGRAYESVMKRAYLRLCSERRRKKEFGP